MEEKAMEEEPWEKENGRMGPTHWAKEIATTVEDKGVLQGIVPSPKAKAKARAKMEGPGGNQIGTTRQERWEERVTKKAKGVRKEVKTGMERPRQEKGPGQDAGSVEEHTSKTNAPRDKKGQEQCRRNSVTGNPRKFPWSGELNLSQWNSMMRWRS